MRHDDIMYRHTQWERIRTALRMARNDLAGEFPRIDAVDGFWPPTRLLEELKTALDRAESEFDACNLERLTSEARLALQRAEEEVALGERNLAQARKTLEQLRLDNAVDPTPY